MADHVGASFATRMAAAAVGEHRSPPAHARRVLRVALDDLDDIG